MMFKSGFCILTNAMAGARTQRRPYYIGRSPYYGSTSPPLRRTGPFPRFPGLSAQTATVYTTTSNNNILRLDFDAGTATPVNTDQTLRKELQGLAVLDDGLKGIHLLVADTGAILIYTNAQGAGALITSAIPQ